MCGWIMIINFWYSRAKADAHAPREDLCSFLFKSRLWDNGPKQEVVGIFVEVGCWERKKDGNVENDIWENFMFPVA